MERTILLNGEDISDKVSAVPPIKSSLGIPGQVIVNDIQTITGIGTTEFWDPLSTGGGFFGQNLADFELEILDDRGGRIFLGRIKEIIADGSGRTVQVQLRSPLQVALERGCIYVSDGPETPAEAVQNILELYSLDIDSGSFANSHDVYTSAGIKVVCRLFNPELTMLQALQSLADIGVASISATAGVIRFDAYKIRTGNPAYTFTDSPTNVDGVTLWGGAPKVSTIQKTQIDGYNIETATGPAITGLDIKQGKSIQAGNEAPISLTSVNAGIGVGELWLDTANRSQELVEWKTRVEIGRELTLGYPVQLDYTQKDWASIVVDVTSIDNSSQLFSVVQGITR